MNQELQLPVNLDAERTILGAVLLDNAAWDEIRAKVRPRDFSLDSHMRIAHSMHRLMSAGGAVDIVTLANDLAGRKEIEAVGGVAYLASLTEGLPLRPVIDEYIRIVKEKSLLRALMGKCSATIASASEQSEPALEIISNFAADLEKLAEPASDANKAQVANFIAEVMNDYSSEFAERSTPAIPSGNSWFDAKTGGGYRQGKITLVCARPNVGKTPWALMSAAHNLKLGRKVVLFSLEMDKSEITRGMIPHFCDLPNIVATRPGIQTQEQHLVAMQAAGLLADLSFVVHDGEMDIDQICWTIDRETRNDEEVLFAVDHFGLIAGGDRKDTRTRYNENSARLRKKMKHKRSAMVALCQLRKVNREFANKPPVADDIKESGNMFEDAFAALIIHRAIEEDTNRMSKDADLNLCKLRSGGSTGSTKGKFDVRRLIFAADAEMEFQTEDYYS